MNRRRPPYIVQRRPVFIGCEGASEAGYAGLLQDLLRDASLPVHLVIENLGLGAGDPLARIAVAVRRLGQLRRTRTEPAERFVLLDDDQTAADPQRAKMARRLATDNNIVIVWQRPCFEAVLLRHLPDRTTRRPPDTSEAIRALGRDWPDYQKPMTRADLTRRINRGAVLRAAAVEPELDTLLRCLGLT